VHVPGTKQPPGLTFFFAAFFDGALVALSGLRNADNNSPADASVLPMAVAWPVVPNAASRWKPGERPSWRCAGIGHRSRHVGPCRAVWRLVGRLVAGGRGRAPCRPSRALPLSESVSSRHTPTARVGGKEIHEPHAASPPGSSRRAGGLEPRC
jgi:hypothetical protein